MSETQQVVAHYTWSTDAPPADGQFCSDSQTWSGASELVFSQNDNTVTDLNAMFGAMTRGDTIRVEQGGNPANWCLWSVNGIPSQAPDMTWTVSVAQIESGGSNVSSGQNCYLVFSSGGDVPGQLPYLPGYWLWNSQAPPPSTSQIRTDSRDWRTAKQVNVDYRTDSGSDASVDLAAVVAGDVLRLEHQTDPTRFAEFIVTAAPLRVSAYYQYAVTYRTGGGVIPNSGTRVLLTRQPAAVTGNEMYWEVTPAREPTRWWITAHCQHGQRSELNATFFNIPPRPTAVVPTVALNLRRRTNCVCTDLTPVPSGMADDGPAAYGVAEVQGYSEVGSG
jgi:hypothetical protein